MAKRAELPTGRIRVVAQIEDAAEIGDAAVLPPERRTYEMEGQDVVLDLRHPDSHRGRVRETEDHDDCENEQQPIAPQGSESGTPIDPAAEASAEQNGDDAETGERAEHRPGGERAEERKAERDHEQLGVRHDERADEESRRRPDPEPRHDTSRGEAEEREPEQKRDRGRQRRRSLAG